VSVVNMATVPMVPVFVNVMMVTMDTIATKVRIMFLTYCTYLSLFQK